MRYDERRAEQAAGDGAIGIGIACVVEPSVSNMGYITLAQTPDERAAALPKSGNAEGCTITISPARRDLGAASRRRRRARGTATVAAQIVADALGVAPEDVDVLTELDTSTNAWSVVVGQLLVALLGRRRGRGRASRPTKLAAKIAAIREHLGDERLAAPRRRHRATGTPSRCRAGWSPGSRRPRSSRRRTCSRPTSEDRVSSSAAHGFIVDVAVVEVDRATGRVHVLDYATVHDAGRLLNPLIVDGQVRGGFAHGAGAALFERIVYDDDGTLLTGTFMDYLCPTAPDLPPLQHRRTARRRRRPRRSARRGSARATRCRRRPRSRTRSPTRSGSSDVELPLTPAARLGAAAR